MTAAAERRYRRLLWAYPGAYRRRHGAEIVTTLLEMAEAGDGRPRAAEALHLLACGLRQRFRLPAGRPLALLAAVLAAIALGALGTAGGTWLGWQTAASVPSPAAMRALTATIGGASPGQVAVYPWETAMNGPATASVVRRGGGHPADQVRDGLTAAGWRITDFSESTGGLVVDVTTQPYTEVPALVINYTATKDGLSLRGDAMSVAADARYDVDTGTDQRLDVWALETAAVRPLTIAGLLLGMLAGWLLTATVAFRVRRSRRAHRRIAAVLVSAAFAAAVVPATVLYQNLYRVLTYDSGAPNPYIDGTPNEHLPVGWTGVAVLAVTAAVLVAVRGARTVGQEPIAS